MGKPGKTDPNGIGGFGSPRTEEDKFNSIAGADGSSWADVIASRSPVAEPDPAAPGEDPETQANLEAARLKERKARGRAATLLAGGQKGIDSGTSVRRTLLGA